MDGGIVTIWDAASGKQLHRLDGNVGVVWSLAWHPDGRRLYSSGAADNSILEVEWRHSRLVPGRTLAVAPPQTTQDERLMNAGFMGGLALSGDGRVLYAAQVYGKAVVSLDLASGAVLARRDLAAEAYTALVAPDGSALGDVVLRVESDPSAASYRAARGGACAAVSGDTPIPPGAAFAVGAMLFVLRRVRVRAAARSRCKMTDP